jgi:hypothetical protein
VNITDVPTETLLAELDRRTRAAAPPKVWFYGVWPGERAGHYVRDKHGNMQSVSRGYYPWNTRENRAEQNEGLFWHRHVDGRTHLLSWDRSADPRDNCAASFIVHDLVTPERALELARANFPSVFARIEQHLGRTVRLAGPTEQQP